MENAKELFEINENGEICFLNKVMTNERNEIIRVNCGASDSYFEDM